MQGLGKLLLLGILGIGIGGGAQPPSPPYHEVKQIVFIDQEQKFALLMGVEQDKRVEHFLMPVYNTSTGEFFTYRLLRKSQGNVSDLAGTGFGDTLRLVALLDNKQVFVFKVVPLSTMPAPLVELSTPERVLQTTLGFERVKAVDTHLLLQQGAQELAILKAQDLKEVKRLSFTDAITDFVVRDNRLLVQNLRKLRIFDLSGAPLKELELPTQALRLGVSELGFLIQQDEKTLLILDRNGSRMADIKAPQPIQALAASKDRVGILSGPQALLFDGQGRQVGVIEGGPFERITASANRFFLHKGQEILTIDAKDGRRIHVRTLQNKLEHLVGFSKGAVAIIREIGGEKRLIYAIYDEDGNRVAIGILLIFEGPRPP